MDSMTNFAVYGQGCELNFAGLMDRWQTEAAARLKRSTVSTYAGIAERHIRPMLGALPAGQVGQDEAAGLIGGMNEAGLSPGTVRLTASVLQSILDYRAQCGILGQPVKVSRPARDTPEARFLSAAEQAALEKYLLGHMSRENLGVYLCLYSGLREGEICALRWEDIDLAAGTLSVRRTVQRICSGGSSELVVGAPKSRASRRTIPLTASALRLAKAMAGPPETYVVTGTEKPMEPRSAQNRFKRVLVKAGIADANFHALRHTFATRCIERGFDVKTLSLILGHADVSTTLNVYVHPSVERMRKCMALLDKKV